MLNTVFLLLIIVISLYLFFSQRYPYIVVAFFSIAGLMLTGVSPHVALSGLSSPATVTIVAMFILSSGLVKTGALNGLTRWMVKSTNKSMTRAYLMLGIVVAFSSAFMNNTPVVMLMVPVVLSISRENDFLASKLFIPLSFFAIFGGSFTLMGTSTNLLVNDIWRNVGGEGFRMFDFLPLGFAIFLAGTIYIIIFGRRILPENQSFSALLPPGKTSNFVTEVVVTEKSPLKGNTLKEFLPKGKSITVMEVIRDEEVFLGENGLVLPLMPGDALIIEGTVQQLTQFKSQAKTKLATVIEDWERVPIRSVQMKFAELVVPPDAFFIGRRVRTLGLNRKFGVKVLAVQRRGRQHHFDLREFRLKPGDVLLVQATEEGLDEIKASEEFLVVDHRIQKLQRTDKSGLSIGIMALVVLLAVFTNLPLVSLALAGAALMVFSRCLRVEEAVASIDQNVLFLLIGTIPLGDALVEAGLMDIFVTHMLSMAKGVSPILLISLLYISTNLFTSVLSNNSVAVLFTPLALGMAQELSHSPQPFLMAVAFGASACFISPIGYQTNLIVMGPGGYTFRDYVKVGVPLTLVVWLMITLMIPLIWPV